ncbi:MAG TPA: hypothetical protein PKM73_15350 [Verrucomicrobiota bacterium]|nr:hypothetical protein [Verrucomicrobiota bacterium]HNU51959.1 hypothetical protein [Verrucomicrobiota bacterium]
MLLIINDKTKSRLWVNERSKKVQKIIDTKGCFPETDGAHGNNLTKETMRTQRLLLAALGVATAATAMAQVYSVNAVGYVNTDLVPGYNLISNPLDNKAGNKVQDLFAIGKSVTIYKYSGGKYDLASYDADFEEWSNGAMVLAPGEGAFVQIVEAAKVTFVGEVVQGATLNKLAQGFNMVSSIVPQTGKLVGELKFPSDISFTVYTYGGGYTLYAWDVDFEEWTETGEPTINVGQAFWVQVPAAKDWARTFDVNNPN